MGLLMAFIVVSMVLFSRDSEQAALDGKYSELFEVFNKAFGQIEGIEVTGNATITFVLDDTSGNELFASGDYYPTVYLKELLNEFIPVYFDELYKVYNRGRDTFEIKEIRIEGHTDSDGQYYRNLQLSADRAGKIQHLILENDYFQTSYSQDFQQFVTRNSIACGYSFSRTLDKNGDFVHISGEPEDKDRSRRVEFRTILEYKK